MKATNLVAADAAVDDHYLNSVSMQATAYTLDATTPSAGAQKVTVTHTSGDTADTLGDLVVVGRDINGNAQTETITLVADSTVSGSKWFSSVSSAITADWVIDGSEATADAIEIGYGADVIVAQGEGSLHCVTVNKTAAGTIILTDAAGVIATLKASIVEASYFYDVSYHGFLQVALGAASDVTVAHTSGVV